MDIAMAKIIAKALFEDDSKVEFVRQAPDARVPNIVTGKVDVCIQFMTVNGQRAQKVNFSRPYYVEAIALLSRPDGKYKTYERSEEHTSELQSLMRISYAVFCLNKKKHKQTQTRLRHIANIKKNKPS